MVTAFNGFFTLNIYLDLADKTLEHVSFPVGDVANFEWLLAKRQLLVVELVIGDVGIPGV